MSQTTFNSPVYLVQNPILGAALLWFFGRAYQDESNGQRIPFPAFFTVLPILLNEYTLGVARSTQRQSGLSKFTSNIESKHREELLAIHHRCLQMRPLTFDSLSVGSARALFSIDYETALVRANTIDAPKIPERLKRQFATAEKMGRWYAQLSLGQIVTLLQVVL